MRIEAAVGKAGHLHKSGDSYAFETLFSNAHRRVIQDPRSSFVPVTLAVAHRVLFRYVPDALNGRILRDQRCLRHQSLRSEIPLHPPRAALAERGTAGSAPSKC